MEKDENGVWETALEGELYGLFYGYKIKHTKVPELKIVFVLIHMQKLLLLLTLTESKKINCGKRNLIGKVTNGFKGIGVI